MDQQFLEAYIDSLVGAMNKLQLENVQYQAQAKIHENLIKQSNTNFKELEYKFELRKQENDKLNVELTDLTNKNSELKAFKQMYEDASQKLSHMNTFQNEVGRLNSLVGQKDAEISSLNQRIKELEDNIVELSKPTIKAKKTIKTE